MDTSQLEKIGLTESEVKVYIALIRLGEVTAGPIVNEAKVTRSKIYDILERLKNKGLINYITKNSTKYFSAADPSNILEYLEEKEKEIEDQKQSIRKIVSDLERDYTKAIEKKTAEIYVGLKGMQNAFNVFTKEFESNEPYYAFGAGKGENVEQIQNFFDRLHKKRIEKKVRSYIIFNESSRGLFKSQEKSRFVEVRYIIESTPAAINIYKNLTIIAILINEPITILIRSSEVSDSFKEYFKVIWKIAKK